MDKKQRSEDCENLEKDEKEQKEVNNSEMESQNYTKGTVSRKEWKEILNKTE